MHTIEALLSHAMSIFQAQASDPCKWPCLSGHPVRTITCALFVRWGRISEGNHAWTRSSMRQRGTGTSSASGGSFRSTSTSSSGTKSRPLFSATCESAHPNCQVSYSIPKSLHCHREIRSRGQLMAEVWTFTLKLRRLCMECFKQVQNDAAAETHITSACMC